MEIHIAKDANQLGSELAGWIAAYIDEVLAKKDRFTFVLSGGGTPKYLYSLLSQAPYKETIPWEKIHFFWGDERAVPYNDDRNNARMCYEELLHKVAVLDENIHVMRTDISPEDSVSAYEGIIEDYFKESETTFDFVLLGMGDDGHTLSLFPGTAVVHESDHTVATFFLPSQDMNRITLTAPVVNRSACVAFMAVGSGKAETLRNVLEGAFSPDLYPSQVINPVKGQLHWFVDEAAASLLAK
jgi:6-phosphogluconolactonase